MCLYVCVCVCVCACVCVCVCVCADERLFLKALLCLAMVKVAGKGVL